MGVPRPLAAAAALVPLVWAAGCSDPPGGTVTATRGTAFLERFQNPAPAQCHALGAAQGVDTVNNNTGVDIVLHKGPGCTDPPGRPSFYLPVGSFTTVVVTQGLWRSFSVVDGVAPVSG